MSKRIVLISVLLTMLISLAGMPASASIDTSAITSFLYEGSSYVPLKSTAEFLGAPLRWDADKGEAIITYKGQDLALTPNSRRAYYAGQPVELATPSVVVDGVTYVPINTFKRFYNVPVTWDRTRSEVTIDGPSGRRTMRSSSRTPWHGGPPPWAPAWGRRANGTPAHQRDAKAYENRKLKSDKDAPRQQRYGTPGHPGYAHADGDAKARNNKTALAQRRYGTPGHPSIAKADGKQKTKGNKKDR